MSGTSASPVRYAQRMRTLAIIIYLILSDACLAQTAWQHYNDSSIVAVESFFQKCSTITSSKSVTAAQQKIDQNVIRLLNKVISDSMYSLQRLKHDCKGFKNRSLDISQKKDGQALDFRLNADGNLSLFLTATLSNGILVSKIIQLETKTSVLCNGNYFTPASIDFLYMKSFTGQMQFPLNIKIYQSYVTIKSDDLH